MKPSYYDIILLYEWKEDNMDNVKREKIKQTLEKMKSYKIEDSLLDTIVLDISRIADKEITKIINEYKKKTDIIITTPEKELLRKYLLGYDVDISNYDNLDYTKLFFNKNDYLEEAYALIEHGLFRNLDSVIGTIYSRTTLNNDVDYKYKNYISTIEKKYSQLLYFKVQNNDEIKTMFESITQLYDSLENYHYCAIEFDEACDWNYIYKIGLYVENFKSEKKLKAFKQEKQINTMVNFLNDITSVSDELINSIKTFYSGVNYGFQFQDLIITKDGKRKLMVLQKVELNENPVPCPSCFETLVRGNSYPKMLYKSFECNNPTCPSRSKIGRGKRFDYYSVKRNNKLLLNSKENYIENKLRNQYRKDIVDNDSDFLEFMINFYTWSENTISYISNNKLDKSNIFDRKIDNININNFIKNESKFYDLPLVDLITEFNNNLSEKLNDIESLNVNHLINQSTIINGNSTTLLNTNLYKETFDLSVTSPPYFNAREYSQWDNLILYLFDMLRNAKAVYSSLKKNGVYAYNIGDIVDKDNVYVTSNMSSKRQILGFYSMLIFEIVGFDIIGNDIWDKGEVQSKRNSSSNSFPGFLRPINCYEHIIYVQKNKTLSLQTKVKEIDTVRKINSKGENKYGHTAPYPEKLVQFIFNRLKTSEQENILILDPFLGSGTTSIVSEKNNFKSVGFELNESYFQLAKDRIYHALNN